MLHATPRELFERQIDCIKRDDRKAQMELYAPDLLYLFPFASDRPRRIEGRDEFEKVMTPIWENGRGRNARLVRCDHRLHEMVDPDFVVVEFDFVVEVEGRTVTFPFVQFIRTRDGLIAEVREYFNPEARARLANES